jgi:hypothetical protein
MHEDYSIAAMQNRPVPGGVQLRHTRHVFGARPSV